MRLTALSELNYPFKIGSTVQKINIKRHRYYNSPRNRIVVKTTNFNTTKKNKINLKL